MDLWVASLLVLWILVLLMAFLLAGALRQIGLFQLRLGDDMGALITDAGLERGTTAPDFEAIDVETGNMRRFYDLALGPSVLVFMTPACLACRQLASHLNEVIATRKDFSFTVLCTGDFATSRAFEDKYHIDTHFLIDPTNRISTEYDVKVTPLVYVLDEYRRVLIRGVANDWNQLESLLEQQGSLQGGRDWAKIEPHLEAASTAHTTTLAKEVRQHARSDP